MGEQPHETAITRVWEAMTELGGGDLEERTRQVSSKQPTNSDNGARDGNRTVRRSYCHLDLLEESTVSVGGATPVVTRPTAEAVCEREKANYKIGTQI